MPKSDRDHERIARTYNLRRRARWILARTTDDLRARADSDDEYTRLGIAAVLRRTLADQKSVATIEAARQGKHLVFAFHPAPAGRPSALPFPQLRLPWEGRFREPVDHGDARALMAARVATDGETDITVSQLVKHFAHVEGAVHIGYPDGGVEEVLGAVFSFRTDGWSHGLSILTDIAFVTANGLDALIAADPRSE